MAVLLALAQLVALDIAIGQEGGFPIAAMVHAELADVHSGPAQVHYPTEKLQRGSMVEIWRYDPGGWCAIRPDAGAFSMIPESATEDLGNDTARITVDGVQAWVGTRLGPVEKPLWQVKLAAGEVVEVIGRCTWPDPEGFSTVWLQIAPPSGEFRWIRRSDLQLADEPLPDAPPPAGTGRAGPDSTTRDAAAAEASSIRNGRARARHSGAVRDDSVETVAFQDSGTFDQSFPTDDPFAGLETPGVRTANAGASQLQRRAPHTDQEIEGPSLTDDGGWRPARRPFQLASAAAVPNIRPAPVSGGTGSNPAPFPPAGVPSPGPVSVPPPAETSPSGDWMTTAATTALPTFGDERVSPGLAALDLQLSREIIKPPEYWSLDELSREAIRLQSTAASDAERSQAGRLIQKIAQFQRTRTEMLSSSPQISASAVASRDRPTGSGLASNLELDATWDAHGWLNELVRQGGQMAPAYVLQDDAGRITHMVTAVPGLNLHRYLKQRVGIMGRRSYDQRLKLSQVEADRIVVLESGRR